MDVERGSRSLSRYDAGPGLVFKLSQILSRFLALMYEAGILALMGWWYHGWKGDPNARVDLIFPCFFPVRLLAWAEMAVEVVRFLLTWSV